jgi:AraC family ethanolamine operon transcriptional activator
MLNQSHQGLNGLPGKSDGTDDRCAIVSCQVQDVEEFSQAFPGFGFSMTQISVGRCEGQFLAIRMAGLQLVRVNVNCAVYTTGSRAPGEIGFSTTLAPPVKELVSHKTALPYQTLFGLDTTREANLVTPEHLDLALVIVSATKFQEYLHELERHDLDEQVFKQNYIQIADERHCMLQTYLRQVFYLATTNPNLLRRSQSLLAGDLLPLLVNCFSAENSPKLCVYPFRRSVMVQQAEDFIMAHLDRPLTLQDLCQAIKASKSALSYGFQEVFGMSPMAYLKIRRLNGVRHALKGSDPETDTVLGIANRYGFWHMGHFSRDYKQLFGESPSETLRTVK